jgi:hypothetical protein
MEFGHLSRYSEGTGWTTGVRFLAGEREFSPLSNVQTASGAHLAPIQ